MRTLLIASPLLAVTAAFAASPTPATPPTPGGHELRIVDFPGAASTQIYAVNNFGQFVGAEFDDSGNPHAIFDDGRKLALLDATGIVGTSFQSWAFSINNRGEIAGAYQQTATTGLHGFIHHPNGNITTIDDPAGSDTQAFGINDLGSVIGVYNDTAMKSHAFVLRHEQFATADVPGAVQTVPLSINDREQIVGEAVTTDHTVGFGYLQQSNGHVTLTTAPGSVPQGTFFISINNREQILGSFDDATGVQQNFLETRGDFQPFVFPARFAATLVSAQTVNDLDEIVGYYNDASQASHGFVALPGRHP